MNLPVIINNRNRLSTTKKLVEDLLNRNTDNIWIIDNDSNYQSLLNWYKIIEKDIKIIRSHNAGHLALFSLGVINDIKEDWCFYTDSDIELNEKMPSNYQEYMMYVAEKYNTKKVGLALKIDDLPEYYPLKSQVVQNEKRWWDKKVEQNLYEADTDTTFCLIKKVDQFSSIRIAGDYECRHIPWYINIESLSDEERFYIENNDNTRVTQYTKQHKGILK